MEHTRMIGGKLDSIRAGVPRSVMHRLHRPMEVEGGGDSGGGMSAGAMIMPMTPPLAPIKRRAA